MEKGTKYSQLNQDYWEILRRHPKYLELCDGVEFDEAGLVDYRDVKTESDWANIVEVHQIANKLFGIHTLLHPRKDWSGYAVLAILGIAPEIVAVMPQQGPEATLQGIWAPNQPPKFHDPKLFIENGRYVTFRVDLTAQKQLIYELLRSYIDYFGEHCETYEGSHGRPQRRHLSKRSEVFRTYDLIREGKRPSEVIKLLWPEEYKEDPEKDAYALDEKFMKLTNMYKAAGLEDHDERAWREAYGKGGGDYMRLYMRVRDRLDLMERLFHEVERPD